MASNILGIDMGGTKISITRYDETSWSSESSETIKTDAKAGLEKVLADVLALVQHHRNTDTRAIGIGVPGLVKHPEGVLLKAPNIADSENVELKTILSDKTGLPVFVENDANCFALTEAILGTGKGHSVVLGVIMGTGVGGGIVIDGKIFHGSHGYAGEFGHMLLVPGKPPFSTTYKRGEVEQFFSGTALGKRCEEAQKPEDYLEGEVCEWLRPEVFQEVAWMCTSLTHLLDPSIIVFGGSTGRALKPHLPLIKEELQKWVLPGTPLPELAIAQYQDAGTLGAALLSA